MVIESRIVVFAGPSIPPQGWCYGRRCERLPPAAVGDLLRLANDPPAIICLIDGYFDATPAPWHKEILSLMSAGWTIFGASSMGALRAAELHALGMIGVGSIFAAYRDGLLTGDDEVACVHAPGDLGWLPLTVPMVEIRATLVAAMRARSIDRFTARAVRRAIHDVHFARRDWSMIEQTCVGQGLLTGQACERLRMGHVRLKQIDAVQCLEAALGWRGPAMRPPPPPRTCYLAALCNEVAADASSASSVAMNAAPVPAGNG